jgi:hypothetical protein
MPMNGRRGPRADDAYQNRMLGLALAGALGHGRPGPAQPAGPRTGQIAAG